MYLYEYTQMHQWEKWLKDKKINLLAQSEKL